MYTILLDKIKVFAYHGVNPEENEQGQDFYIDAKLSVDQDLSSLRDQIEDTVSYAAVNKLILRESTHCAYQLIETLCDKLGTAVLQEFPAVSEVEITVNKPNAPMKGEFQNVAVRAVKRR